MRRLIDANAMHKFVEEKVAEGKDGWANGVPYEWAYALTAVDLQPTVDAVEVVRCKDCKHFDEEKALRCGGIWCGYWGTDPDPDDFCSYGERREGE